jgi:protein tyrosine phosphatase
MSINLSSGRTRSKPPCPLDNVKIENVTLRDGGDIAATVDGMRDYRNMLVQTPEQFALIYKMSASWK